MLQFLIPVDLYLFSVCSLYIAQRWRSKYLVGILLTCIVFKVYLELKLTSMCLIPH